MALILKKSYPKSKGIIIFTHKEIFPIFSSQKTIFLDLKKKYFIGVHTGNYSKDVLFPNEIDFFLSSNSLLNNKYQDKLIPLCSRNFLDSEFEYQNINNKRFDICCSNRAFKIKNTKLLLSAIKNLNKQGVFLEVLFVLPKAKNENKLDFDSDIFDFYNNLFNEKEKTHITFIRLSSELDFLGINQKTISWFLNNSKIFFAGSSKEGTCKASHEALLCGCKILYIENTKSAIPDYLNEKNSRSFDSISNLEKKIIELLDLKYKYENKDLLDYELSERFTKDKLQNYFTKFFTLRGEKFEGDFFEIDNFSRRLPAHYMNVPWKLKDKITADILSKKQFKIFLEYIGEQNLKINNFPFQYKNSSTYKWLRLKLKLLFNV